MGRITYLIMGLIIGAGAGIIGMQIWTGQYSDAPSPTTPKKAILSESYFLCKSEYAKGEFPLIIKSDASGAKEMIYPSRTDADVFIVEKISDLHYVARNPNPEAPEAYTSLDFNRLTGELISQSRLPTEAVQLLLSICEKRVEPSECRPRIERIKGGSMWQCLNASEVSCPRLKYSGLPAPLRYQCRRAEARF